MTSSLLLWQIYPPNEKWGLFSLHMLGRTGYEVCLFGRSDSQCECQYKKLTEKKVKETHIQPEVQVTEVLPSEEKEDQPVVEKENIPVIEKENQPVIEKEDLPVIEKENRPVVEKKRQCVIVNNIVLSESESCQSSPLSLPQEVTPLPTESCGIPDLLLPPVLPVMNECNETTAPKEMIEEPVMEVSIPQPSVSTPPRTSVKRSVVCNDSPITTPSKICSVSHPVFTTPIKSLGNESKSVKVSPTKVVFEEEDIALPVFENKSLVMTAKMRRLMKEQEEERNRFRYLMKKQIVAIQSTFNIGLERWNGVLLINVINAQKEFAEIQKQYKKQYVMNQTSNNEQNELCRTLQLQYNTLIAKQIHHMQYYNIPVSKEKVYSLDFPKISFSMKLF